ncbi:hypothetical protein B296_00048060 [Ensete ventricosum]|uniref:Uncharacterized protein n=1 Tax=Ensete ventricosum TaxID=4639 RepID=A0A426X6W6_ENSVE|nr:hypothetical protein B296_00048060 [Ensete ventricosum]
MYRAASRPICESLATGRYRAFSLVSSDSWLYRAIMVEISIVTAWYRSVMVDFDRRRPLLGSINLTAIGCGEASTTSYLCGEKKTGPLRGEKKTR